MALVTRELGLEPGQQAELRKILEEQRAQVARIWSDASVPPASRIGATQAISDRTSERIRAMLNDEQRKKYQQPHLHRPEGAPQPDVGAWMKATSPRVTAPQAAR